MRKGSFDRSWSFTLGSTTYSHFAFEDDVFLCRDDSAALLIHAAVHAHAALYAVENRQSHRSALSSAKSTGNAFRSLNARQPGTLR